MADTRLGPLVPATLLLLLSAAPAAAHNPALSVHVPTPLDSGLLLLGEEGTAALLEPEGTVRWEERLDLHLLQAAVPLSETLAVTVARSVADGTLVVVAFGPEGAASPAVLDGPGTFAHLVPDGEGAAVFTDEPALHRVAPDGTHERVQAIAAASIVAPVRSARGDWVLGTGGGELVTLQPDGTRGLEARLSGTPTGLSVLANGDLAVAVRGSPNGDDASLLVLDERLETVWARSVPGFQLGGAPAPLGEGAAVGTYRPEGARVHRLVPPGEIAWEVVVPDATAAATTVADDVVYVAANRAVLALSADGELAWTTALRPRLTGPAVLDGLVVPASLDNNVTALDAGTGEVRWTYSDGLTSVPWSDEGLARPRRPDPQETPTPWPAAWALAAAVLAALARSPWRRGSP